MDSHIHKQSEENLEDYRVMLYDGPSNDQFGLTADDDLEEDFNGDLSVEDVEENVRRSLQRRSAREEEEETRERDIERGGAALALPTEVEPTEVRVGQLLLRYLLAATCAATYACLFALLFILDFFIILFVVLPPFLVRLSVDCFIHAFFFLSFLSARTLEALGSLSIPFGTNEADDAPPEPEMSFEPALSVELEPSPAPSGIEAASPGPGILVEEEVDMEWNSYPTPSHTSLEPLAPSIAPSSPSTSATTTPASLSPFSLSTSSSFTSLSSLASE